MWLQTNQDSTERLYDAELEVSLEFSDNNTVQVDEENGNALLDKYPNLSEYTNQ